MDKRQNKKMQVRGSILKKQENRYDVFYFFLPVIDEGLGCVLASWMQVLGICYEGSVQ